MVSPISRYRDSGNLFAIYPLFPYLSQMWGGIVFLAFYAISNISRKKNILGIHLCQKLFKNHSFSFNVFFVFFFMLDLDSISNILNFLFFFENGAI